MFDNDAFLADLATFVSFRTVVCRNPEEFRRANAWIRDFFDPQATEFEEFQCHGLTSTLIKPRGSTRPNLLGDGHIEVVPADEELFTLREEGDELIGRGVADMKTQCLMMMYVLRDLIAERRHNDFWLLFSEDEEIGSAHGVAIVADRLVERGLLPKVVFAPDGGPNFSYVEKEKGIMTFIARTRGRSAHASRPYLGANAIDQMMLFYDAVREAFPNPAREEDWVISVSMTRISAGEAANKIPDACEATFDLRFPEEYEVGELTAKIEELGSAEATEIELRAADPATYYPRSAPVAREFLRILERVSGREPHILHSAGASNGRLYVARDPEVHVLMSGPRMGGAHGDVESVARDSLAPYYELVRATAGMVAPSRAA